ncbi:Casein kinase I isoform delta [Cichlidogyrus casuarinus]|uniref:non-specific serine/threonine protein kinase n=1 Tax=Cichlidogyrus casuarinus TaxID=1844966 RepID=A0ABD2QM90_9PLAT
MFRKSTDSRASDSEEYVIDGEWKLVSRIGGGSFGELFVANGKSSKEMVAVKMELIKQNQNHLKSEYQLLKMLDNHVGIPKIYWYGKDADKQLYNCLVMELLGPSIEELLVYCKGKFSLKTTLMVADQMLKRIKVLHDNCLIHRDIKPDNFVMGVGKKFNSVYVIDLGLSKFYMNPRTKQHEQFREFRSLTGTARYCSINTHSGYEQSRRDDLESLAYVWIYLMKGQLPWQGLIADGKREKFQKIFKTKVSISPEMLCNGLPSQFIKILEYTRKLSFEEEPKYKKIHDLIYEMLEKRNINYDFEYDWIPNKKK